MYSMSSPRSLCDASYNALPPMYLSVYPTSGGLRLHGAQYIRRPAAFACMVLSISDVRQPPACMVLSISAVQTDWVRLRLPRLPATCSLPECAVCSGCSTQLIPMVKTKTFANVNYTME
eukprot:gene21638-26025_t